LGFLKFLKRDKAKEADLELEGLDMPPAPPDILDKPKIPPQMQQPDEPLELPPLEEPPTEEPEKPISEFKLPQLEPLEPQEPLELKEAMPNKPLFGTKKFEPEIPKPVPDIDIEPARKHYQKIEKAAIREEKDVLAHKTEIKGPIYVKVDRFRKILTGISVTKSDLKMIDESVVKLNKVDEERDKEFEKWKSAMQDMQKKFIFIDKTIFKR